MSYLIDTDILIYSLKNDTQVKQKFKENLNIPKSISVITYGELVYGARKSQHVEKNLPVVYRIAEIFPVLDINKPIMDIFGEIKCNLKRNGKIIQDMDILIAATALTHNLTLVTNNIRHFKNIPDLRIENWKRN
ncbi:MAG: type II toxin-antitoxin system VapC family toxin [Candidatus Aminicenantes bacterium]